MKAINVSGKRKMAIARATVKDGKGIVRINSMLLEAFGTKLVRLMIKEPLLLAGNYSKKYDINVIVKGGGWHSQAEAIRLVVAKGLVESTGSKKLKQTFLDYDRHLLVSDVRRTEPCKPNVSKARKKRQKSYR